MWASRFLFLALLLAGLIPTAFRPFMEVSQLLVYMEFLVPFSIVLIVGLLPQSPGNLLLEKERIFYSVISFSALSLFVGLAFGWLAKDIIADVARFVAPFIAFSVAFRTFAQSSDLAEEVQVYLRIVVLLVGVSILVKGYFVVFQGSSVVQYGVLHLRQEFIAPILLVFLRRKLSVEWKISLFIMIAAIVLSPILAASKTNTILAISWFVLFLYAWKAPLWVRFFLVGVTSVIAILVQSVVAEDALFVFGRIGDSVLAIVDLDSGVVGSDMSTLGRVAEAESALDTMDEYFPISWLVGMGSGALWNPIGGISFEGLHESNFRLAGGGHHIHLTWVAVFFRYGLLGVFLYCLFLLRLLIRAYSLSAGDDVKAAYPFSWALSAHIILSAIGSLFTYFIYGAIEFGIIAGLFCAVLWRQSRIGQSRIVESGIQKLSF